MNDSLLSFIKSTPLQELPWRYAKERGVNVWIKREDLIHPACPGNKWYKLIYNLVERDQTPDYLISFGGPYSNHIHALAQVGKLLGITTVGIIRGFYANNLTPTLIDCRNLGMELIFVSKSTWRQKDSALYQLKLKDSYSNAYVIPEGGANSAGVKGCFLIGQSIRRQWSSLVQTNERQNHSPVQVYLACGTGTTMAGVICGLDSTFEVHGISALKGENTLTEAISAFVAEVKPDSKIQWQVHHDYHLGGYAKITDELVEFIKCFESEHQILLDPVYTAKVLFAIKARIDRGIIREGERVIIIHTGGVQGRRGYGQFHDHV